VIANAVLLALGTIELLPPTAPLTMLVWGIKRIVPVRLDGLTITETMHDTSLNPIRAQAALRLNVLSYEDLSITNPGYYIFLAHQVMKESMALLNTVNNTAAVLGAGISLI